MSSHRLLSLTIKPEDTEFTEINPQQNQKANTQDFQNLGVNYTFIHLYRISVNIIGTLYYLFYRG